MDHRRHSRNTLQASRKEEASGAMFVIAGTVTGSTGNEYNLLVSGSSCHNGSGKNPEVGNVTA
jgi:hypothetical protein